MVTLGFAERLLLANQFRMLELLDPGSAVQHKQSREIVEAGYQYLYETINPALTTANMPPEIGEEVAEILDMFRTLERSSRELGKTAGELQVAFDGFDDGQDAYHHQFARFTRRTMSLWKELAEYPDTAQELGSLQRYRSMLVKWRAFGKPESLSEDQISSLPVG